MADYKNEIQYSLGLDTTEFKAGLNEAQADLLAAQQMVQRMNTEQQQAPIPAALPPGTGAPPPPPPTPPLPPPGPTQQQGGNAPKSEPQSTPEQQPDPVSPIQQAQAELERIRSVAQTSPEIAMLQLQGNGGRGGLQSQIFKGAATASTPEEIEAYQELIKSLKSLTDSVQKQTQEGKDPASSLLNLLRNDMMIRTGSGIAQQFMQGNVIGGLSSGAGAGIGMLLGGPAGAAAGAQLGQMLGGILAPFFGGATESEQRAMERADIAARFGRPETAESLSVANIAAMDTSGYSVDETMRLFDTLRQQRVVDDVDEGSAELVENIQELSRVLGLNTDALVQNYSAYKTQGGEMGINDFMNQQIAGAVSAGMRENLGDYLELTSSSSRQLVATNFDADAGGGMRRIQQMLTGLIGQDNRMGGLLRDNPMMAQQMMSSLLATGTTNDPFGIQSVMMRAAGVQGSQMLSGFATPDQQAANALQQVSYINQRFFQRLNVDQGELQGQAQTDPNFVRDKLLQDEGSQVLLNQLIAEQYTGGNAGAVTPEQRAMVMQLMQQQLTTGSLTPEMALPDGQTVQELLGDYQKSDTAAIRESIEKAQTSLDELGEIFQPIFSEFRSVLPELLRGLISGLNDVVTETGPELKAAWQEFKPVLQNEVIPALSSLSQVITSVLGNNAVQGVTGAIQSVNDIAQNPFTGTLRTVGRVANAGIEASQMASPAGVATAAGNRMLRNGFDWLRDHVLGDEESTQKIDAAFNDTPSSGILATQEFNTFQFAAGDRIFAQQQGGGSSPTTSMSAPITIQQHFHGAAEPDLVEVAARQGAGAGFDEFVQRWQSRDTSAVRLYPTNY